MKSQQNRIKLVRPYLWRTPKCSRWFQWSPLSRYLRMRSLNFARMLWWSEARLALPHCLATFWWNLVFLLPWGCSVKSFAKLKGSSLYSLFILSLWMAEKLSTEHTVYIYPCLQISHNRSSVSHKLFPFSYFWIVMCAICHKILSDINSVGI